MSTKRYNPNASPLLLDTPLWISATRPVDKSIGLGITCLTIHNPERMSTLKVLGLVCDGLSTTTARALDGTTYMGEATRLQVIHSLIKLSHNMRAGKRAATLQAGLHTDYPLLHSIYDYDYTLPSKKRCVSRSRSSPTLPCHVASSDRHAPK